MIKYVLMDLDGTLTNSEEGITKSFEYALSKFGIKVDSLESLRKFIGPPLYDSFVNGCGLSEEDSDLATKYYRERYEKVGKYENTPYAGIKESLAKLKNAGKVLIVATSKPENLAVDILHHFGLAEYFTDICGAASDKTRSTKDEVIKYAMKKNGVVKEETIMVGDRCYDIEGAKMNGLYSMGVLYGFGNKEEFEREGADFIAETTADVADIILK
ncbi:MAG: HAD hydrolase-like protein [Lachnospiraceae bacterium]|nr:HAD hydrolase-like protein [Lachnospiraceae bacterium]